MSDPVDEVDCMFEEGMNFSVFYCFCFVNEISTDMLEEQLKEENTLTFIRRRISFFFDDRWKNWKNVIEDNNEYTGKVHDLRWKLHMKEMEYFIKTGFSVRVPHPKWGNTIWMCVKDHIIN